MYIRLLFFGVGLLFLSLGVSLTIISDLGAGPWDSLSVGLSNTVGFSIGTWVFVVSFIMILVNAVIQKNKPDFPALLTGIVLGAIIDFWMINVFHSVVIEGFMMKVAILLCGIIILAVGVSIYIQASFSPNPVDNFMLSLNKRFGMPLMYAKLTGEVIAFILAFLLSGPIGIGTFIIGLSIGPSVQFLFPYGKKLYTTMGGCQEISLSKQD